MKYEPKKVIEIPEIEFNRVVAGQYKTSVINPDGSVESEGDWSKNLILDCGLDKIAYMPWAQVLLEISYQVQFLPRPFLIPNWKNRQ